ncbi:MAG: DUF1064 domain-containing protein [Lachnospiraceae bacterium]|nr:DUF1064 domain-containing protein [Lachnospiraceae bacterium]
MKYHNKLTEIDGIKFHSRKEAERYTILKLMEKSGGISNLELQKKYVLIPTIPAAPGVCSAQRSCCYIADFVYTDNKTGRTVVEDVKGMRTEVYKIKKKLMRYIHGIIIQEV